MDSKRAKEILSSSSMIDVAFNGSMVYIEKVNESNDTCTVHYMNRPDQKMDVLASSLTELA